MFAGDAVRWVSMSSRAGSLPQVRDLACGEGTCWQRRQVWATASCVATYRYARIRRLVRLRPRLYRSVPLTIQRSGLAARIGLKHASAAS